MSNGDPRPWAAVLHFWFPEGTARDIAPDTHREHWRWRLHGGADKAIAARFAGAARRGAAGELAGWAQCPEGRLALIIALDQFSRSLWRDTARAYAQDGAALALSLAGLANGDHAALAAPWQRIAFTQPLGHAEGPDHLARIDRLIALREAVAADAPTPLRPIYESLVMQARRVREIIARFGRHPHRNAILGRVSSPEERAYLETGAFPHLRALRD